MIEYVTKNEETDELELKPISYGIPQSAASGNFFLDYSKSQTGIEVQSDTEWTAPADGWVNASMYRSTTSPTSIAINDFIVFEGYSAANERCWAGPVRGGDKVKFSYNGALGGTNRINFTPYD